MASFIATVQWTDPNPTEFSIDKTTVNVSADDSDEAMDIAYDWMRRRGFINIIAVSVKEV